MRTAIGTGYSLKRECKLFIRARIQDVLGHCCWHCHLSLAVEYSGQISWKLKKGSFPEFSLDVNHYLFARDEGKKGIRMCWNFEPLQ